MISSTKIQQNSSDIISDNENMIDEVKKASFQENNQNLVICFGLILILFNPIIPIYLGSKVAWFLPDLIAAGIFAYYGYKDDDYN